MLQLASRCGAPAAQHAPVAAALAAAASLQQLSSRSSRLLQHQSREQPCQDALVAELERQGLLSARAAAAMRAVDRRHFVQAYCGVPEAVGYNDSAVPIGCGQHMPPPSITARVLSLLETVRPGAHVLDVGAGSGYTAALLGQLVSPGGRVLALEKHAKLVERAGASIRASNPELLQQQGTGVELRTCNVMAAPPELAAAKQFDAVHVGASVVEGGQQRFLRLLKPGGRLVLPLGGMHGGAPQVLVAIDKAADGTTTISEHGPIATRIAPLTALHDDNVMP